MATGYLCIGEFREPFGASAKRLGAWEPRHGLLAPRPALALLATLDASRRRPRSRR